MNLQDQVRDVLNRRINRGSTSLTQIAGKSGVGCSHLSNFRNRKRCLSSDSLAAVISALDLQVELFPNQASRIKALGRVAGTSDSLQHHSFDPGRSARLPIAD